ncbi:DUF3291 domain-containing protein [Erythrobacter sp. EC-HK427]|uniref:DUF3291 domain-containing protein n=1 Tax=Erythrobacter sp. EC-HK427 TaxID=2038396 RepID=UPI0012514683|nr:DUF3291 domain-containing protein [Erythrobacter sp. EC-HK427]VVT11901.1 conserved hypothetical protein [Erythrobacter sp. EC-HK427]
MAERYRDAPENGWHLAQINIGRLIAPQGDPRVQPFFDALDRINALAETSPGFVWRLKDETGHAMDIRYSTDPLLAVNMTVWRDADALFDFVYRSAHTPVMARRREYFSRMDGAYQALWWIPAGTRPTVNDGLAKLWLLDQEGPTPLAFTFKSRFPAPGMEGPPVDHKPDPWCMGNA